MFDIQSRKFCMLYGGHHTAYMQGVVNKAPTIEIAFCFSGYLQKKKFFLSCSKIPGVQPCLSAPLPHTSTSHLYLTPLPHILILACHKFKRPRLELTSHYFVKKMWTRGATSHKDFVEMMTRRRGRGLAVPQVIKTMTRHHKS